MLIVIFVSIFVATILLPQAVIEVLIINTLIGLLISALQITITVFPSFKPRRIALRQRPLVSILVPAYNEPPALLIQTLDALSRLTYDNFEVLIIDNNTTDPAIWKPVERFCGVLGERFRFFHEDPLSGFKAGALNYALSRVHAASQFVAVIDADYVVKSYFLTTALSYFSSPDIAFVQFPQQYRNIMSKNQPIADEYHHFFKIYMNMANHLDCVPSTGTVSVYTRGALDAIGGFRADTLTEDADAGLRIYKAGYRGVYIEQAIGHGLIPYDIEAYRKQKHRWALGNAQSLWTLFSLFGKVSTRSWLGFLSHLTAWDHLNFLPFAAIAGYALVVTPLIPTTGFHQTLLDVASFSIFITILSKLVLFMVTFRGQEKSISRALKAFVVHMGMTFLYSEALVEFLFSKKQSTFVRTNKFIHGRMPNMLRSTYKELALGIWFLVGAVETVLFGGRTVTLVAFLISASALLSVLYVYWSIRPTKKFSKELLEAAERKYSKYLTGGVAATTI